MPRRNWAEPRFAAYQRMACGGKSALMRRFQALEQQCQQGVSPRRELRIAPFLGMSGMMEADGRIEDRPRRRFNVGSVKRALRHAVRQNVRDLIDLSFL